jgi:hypothetical protein
LIKTFAVVQKIFKLKRKASTNCNEKKFHRSPTNLSTASVRSVGEAVDRSPRLFFRNKIRKNSAYAADRRRHSALYGPGQIG